MNEEIQEILKSGTVRKVRHTTHQFLSNLFLVRKKDGNHPVKNLRDINSFVPKEHFKMESLHCLKFLLQENNFLCNIDLKGTHFSILL